jgi:protein involved in polysaccharide export with SLBB domain
MLFCASVSHGQITRATDLDFSRLNSAAFYKYAESGDVTVLVNVWGTVRFPGRYELRQGVHLGDLISLAGGPLDRPLDPEATERTITVKVSRGSDQGRRIMFNSILDDIVESPQNYPILQEGDVVLIETLDHQKFRVRDALPIANLLATLALIVVRVIELR